MIITPMTKDDTTLYRSGKMPYCYGNKHTPSSAKYRKKTKKKQHGNYEADGKLGTEAKTTNI